MRATYIAALILLIAATGCKTKQHAATAKADEKVVIPKPATYGHTAHAVVYRTKGDYDQYVPITLTDDGAAVASYPAPTDIYYKGKIATPTKLSSGYLLDNRGITPHSAFIKITYEEYAKLKEVPSLKELYNLVIDKAPFKDMYDLGERNTYGDDPAVMNAIIKSDRLSEYRKLL